MSTSRSPRFATRFLFSLDSTYLSTFPVTFFRSAVALFPMKTVEAHEDAVPAKIREPAKRKTILRAPRLYSFFIKYFE